MDIISPSKKNELLELGDPGEDFFLIVAETFLEDMPTAVEEIKSAFAEFDQKRIQKSVHKLTGASRNIGAEKLAHVCATIEQKAVEQQISSNETEGLFSQITSVFGETCVELQNYKQSA